MDYLVPVGELSVDFLNEFLGDKISSSQDLTETDEESSQEAEEGFDARILLGIEKFKKRSPKSNNTILKVKENYHQLI